MGGSIVCAQFSPKSVDTHTTSVDQTAIYSTDTVLVPGVGVGGSDQKTHNIIVSGVCLSLCKGRLYPVVRWGQH